MRVEALFEAHGRNARKITDEQLLKKKRIVLLKLQQALVDLNVDTQLKTTDQSGIILRAIDPDSKRPVSIDYKFELYRFHAGAVSTSTPDPVPYMDSRRIFLADDNNDLLAWDSALGIEKFAKEIADKLSRRKNPSSNPGCRFYELKYAIEDVLNKLPAKRREQLKLKAAVTSHTVMLSDAAKQGDDGVLRFKSAAKLDTPDRGNYGYVLSYDRLAGSHELINTSKEAIEIVKAWLKGTPS